MVCVTALFAPGFLLADVPDFARTASIDYRCALRVFECSDSESCDRPQLFIFPKARIPSIEPDGISATRVMCAYAESQCNSTGRPDGFRFRNWMKLGEKYATADDVFQCVWNEEKSILSPNKKDVCVMHEDSEVPVTYESLVQLIQTIESKESVQCKSRENSHLVEAGVCHPPPKALGDLPGVQLLNSTEYSPKGILYFDSGKEASQRSSKPKESPSFPHGWCYPQIQFTEVSKDEDTAILDLTPFFNCPCQAKHSVGFSDDTIQFERKFTHQEWAKGKRIRKKHITGHPGYDHSLPYSCDQICAPHFGLTQSEISQFSDRKSLLNAITERQEYFERHENDPTKPCVIPKGVRKTVGCRCALRSRHKTPVKGTSRSFVSVSGKPADVLSSPTMVSASAPSVSSSFSLGDQKFKSPKKERLRPKNRPVNSLVRQQSFDRPPNRDPDEGAESWFPLFLSWSYSAACGSGSTSALCEWWDFLQFITESTALALSTICDAFRWTF